MSAGALVATVGSAAAVLAKKLALGAGDEGAPKLAVGARDVKGTAVVETGRGLEEL